jgi:hypothetical protein
MPYNVFDAPYIDRVPCRRAERADRFRRRAAGDGADRAIAHVRERPPEIGETFAPVEAHHAIYEQQLRRQRRLYTKLFEEN